MPRLPINLAIVDDHALFRRILKSYLSEQPNILISIQAPDLFELFEKLKDRSIDILLTDIFLPVVNIIDALKSLRSMYPDIKILIVSTNLDSNLISDLLDVGIHGYISKSDEPEELLQAIQAAVENRIYRNRLLTEALYWSKQKIVKSYRNDNLAVLNDREKRILQLLWEEKSSKEIADELFLGIRSVEKIRQDIKEKTGVKSTVGLLKYAIDKGIIAVNSVKSGLISR